uniref:Tetratricopeptide repeat protein 29 n=2 Tax=Hemiselmis andersenii TaxID=464988 RepID=A0A6U4KN14_HEMAN
MSAGGNKQGTSQGVSGESESIADKYFVCTECLVEGSVQSFVDLFYLTHAVDAQDTDEDSSASFATYETLQFLKARLTEAEVANRQAQHSSVFASYMDIAHHYQGQHDYKTSIYFLTKALDVARLAEDAEREADANQMLGLAHERMGSLRTAIEFHETHRDIVTTAGVELPAESGRHLIGAYKALAEELQRQGDYTSAIGYFERSLKAAQTLGDFAGEGLAYQQLGNAYQLQRDFVKAAECFKKFLDICQETDDKIAEGSACSSLASAYEAVGDRASSIKYLEAFYEVALTTGELTAQREACGRLGIIFNTAGDYTSSVHYFSKSFEISRSLGDQKAVDVARVNLGVARGCAKKESYLKIVSGSMDALLGWKNRRTPFDDPPR